MRATQRKYGKCVVCFGLVSWGGHAPSVHNHQSPPWTSRNDSFILSFSTKGERIVATTRESLPTNQLSEPASHDANYYRQAFCSLGRQAHRTARVGGTNLGESILVSGGRFRGEVPGVRTEPVVGLQGQRENEAPRGGAAAATGVSDDHFRADTKPRPRPVT